MQWLCDQNDGSSGSEAPQCPLIPSRAAEESPSDGQLITLLTAAAGGQEAELRQVAAQVKTYQDELERKLKSKSTLLSLLQNQR